MSNLWYRIYSNKRRGAYLIFCVSSAGRLFEGGAYWKGLYYFMSIFYGLQAWS